MSWSQVKLRSILVANYGKALKKENRDEGGKYEVFGSAGFVGNHSEPLITNETIIIGRKGSVGKVIHAPNGGWVIDTAFYLTLKEKVKLDWRYLFYVLKSSKLDSKTITTSIPGLNRDDFYDTEIPLPPLDEQKRIAAILDKADAIRRKRQQAIQLADDFLRSVFLDMFGDPKVNPKNWVRCKFSDLINLATYGLTVRPEYISEGIPLISAREIRTGSVVLDTAPKISQEDFDKLSDKAKPKVDDILFSKTGSIGHCAIVINNKEFAVTQNAARIVPNTEKVDPVFLLSLMRTKYFYDLSNREAKGNAVKDLQLGVMKEFEVYCPLLEKQIEFVRIRKNILAMAEKQQNCSQGSDNNFFALSQKAFAGEL
ncbi:MAG: type I restriction enzyme S subunit [Gammaproteobacteria bacterium]